jgi:hypothetical protein
MLAASIIAKRRSPVVLTVCVGLFLLGQATVAPAGASTTVTVAPSVPPGPSNCYPFGEGGTAQWAPFMGFVYKNVPAFNLQTGDALAFDLGAIREADVQLQIGLAATTVNGGDVPSGAFTTVVTNTQTLPTQEAIRQSGTANSGFPHRHPSTSQGAA